MGTTYTSILAYATHISFLQKASSKNTGMHPAIMELNVDRRVGVSPGGWRQNLDFNIGTMERIVSWVHAPAVQSTRVHMSVWLAYCEMMGREVGEAAAAAATVEPPPAKSIRVVRPDLAARISQSLRRGKKEGWNDKLRKTQEGSVPEDWIILWALVVIPH
jgi:hypothetical protein